MVNPRSINEIGLPNPNTLCPKKFEIMPVDWDCVEVPKNVSA